MHRGGAAVDISSQGLVVGWSFLSFPNQPVLPSNPSPPSNNSTGEATNTQIRTPQLWHPHASVGALQTAPICTVNAGTNCALTWRANNMFTGQVECRDNNLQLPVAHIMRMDIQIPTSILLSPRKRIREPAITSSRFTRRKDPWRASILINTRPRVEVLRVSIKRRVGQQGNQPVRRLQAEPRLPSRLGARPAPRVSKEPEIQARGVFSGLLFRVFGSDSSSVPLHATKQIKVLAPARRHSPYPSSTALQLNCILFTVTAKADRYS